SDRIGIHAYTQTQDQYTQSKGIQGRARCPGRQNQECKAYGRKGQSQDFNAEKVLNLNGTFRLFLFGGGFHHHMIWLAAKEEINFIKGKQEKRHTHAYQHFHTPAESEIQQQWGNKLKKQSNRQTEAGHP